MGDLDEKEYEVNVAVSYTYHFIRGDSGKDEYPVQFRRASCKP